MIEKEKLSIDERRESVRVAETKFFEGVREMERAYYEQKNVYQEKENQKALLENKQKYLETESARTAELAWSA